MCVFVWCVRSHARTMVFIIAMPVSWCSEPCLYHGVHQSHACTMVCVYEVCMGCVCVCVCLCECLCVCVCVCVCVCSHAFTMVFIRAMPSS